MSSKFVEITDFNEAVEYSEAGLLVAKDGFGHEDATYWHMDFWPLRVGKYGILVEEDDSPTEKRCSDYD